MGMQKNENFKEQFNDIVDVFTKTQDQLESHISRVEKANESNEAEKKKLEAEIEQNKKLIKRGKGVIGKIKNILG